MAIRDARDVASKPDLAAEQSAGFIVNGRKRGQYGLSGIIVEFWCGSAPLTASRFQILWSMLMRPSVSAEFAKRLYRRHHGAWICPTYLNWQTVNAADGKPLAVLGYRAAADGPLFLESYLDDTVEITVAKALCIDVDRADIVEIGCLAALPSPALVRLWHRSATALGDRFSVAVATLTAPLRHGFARVGLPLVPVAPAKRGHKSMTKENWGRYYDQDPMVCVGLVADGAAALSRYAARLDLRA